MISLGVAAYKDFYYKDLRGLTIDQYSNLGVVTAVVNDETDIHVYKDELQVYTSSFTLKFSYFAFDNISFVTNFVDHDYAQEAWFAQVSSFSLFLGNWIFSVGGRSEVNDKEVYIEGEFLPQEQKEYSFWGMQYASDTGLMFGVFYNYYLLTYSMRLVLV
jgi:hypothetical protein